MYYTTLYRYIEGNVKSLGWYPDREYTTENRAKNRIRKLEKMDLVALSQEFNITVKQAKTLEYHFFRTKKRLI